MAFVDRKDLRNTAIALGAVGILVAPSFFYQQEPAVTIPHPRSEVAKPTIEFNPREKLLEQFRNPNFMRIIEDMHDRDGENPRFLVCSVGGTYSVKNAVTRREAPTKSSGAIEELNPTHPEIPAHILVKINRYVENISGVNDWIGSIDSKGQLTYIAQEQAYREYLLTVNKPQNCEEVPLPAYLGTPDLIK